MCYSGSTFHPGEENMMSLFVQHGCWYAVAQPVPAWLKPGFNQPILLSGLLGLRTNDENESEQSASKLKLN